MPTTRAVFYVVLLLFCCGWPLSGPAQQEGNPFELTPRLKVVPSDSIGDVIPGNPFDIVSDPAPGPATPSILFRDKGAAPVTPADRYRRVKLFVILGILILLAFLATVLRTLVRKSALAFTSDTIMNQLYREQEGRGIIPFWLLYLLFFINAGVFVFFLLRHYEIPFLADRPSVQLGVCIAAVSTFLLAKHLLLWFIAYVFSVEKEISRYTFTMIIFGIITGLLLVPVNIFLAYAEPSLAPVIIAISIGIVGLIYAFRYLRSLLIANKFLSFHKFHFLLYICTVEIAPVLFVLKIVLNYL